jgi:hypothetical protein
MIDKIYKIKNCYQLVSGDSCCLKSPNCMGTSKDLFQYIHGFLFAQNCCFLN